MNLLIVCNKSDVKTYETVIKSAPNTSVLGAVTRLTPDFLSELGSKYNPHAVVVDTSVSVKNTEIDDVIEKISLHYPYMKILVLTDENDNKSYPSYCTVKGFISSVELKRLLEKMSSGENYTSERKNANRTDTLQPTGAAEEKTPVNVFQSKVDNLSTLKSSRTKKSSFQKVKKNPIVLAVSIASVIAVVLIAIIVVKSVGKGSPDVATSDEAQTTAEGLIDAEELLSNGENSTESESGYLVESTTAVAYTPNKTNAAESKAETQPPNTANEKNETSSDKSSSASSGSSVNNSNNNSSNNSSGGSSNGGSSSNSNSRNSSSGSSSIGGEPIVSYDNNGYSNSQSNAVSSVKLSYSSKTLYSNEGLQLSATVYPSTANKSITWSSSNSSVVSVNSNGYITAHKVGSATITAKANNGVSASCSVKVISKPVSDAVHLSASVYYLSLNQSVTVTLYGSNGAVWSVDENIVAFVGTTKNSITIKAKSRGTVILTAKDKSSGKKYLCTIYIR